MNKRNLMKGKKSEMKYALKKDGNGSSGITLIALVITIIVLLILAGVVIATLSGENGILRRAGEASENSKRAEIVEQLKLRIMEKVTPEHVTITATDVKDVLTNSGYFETSEISKIGDNATVEEMKAISVTTKANYGEKTISLSEVLGTITTSGDSSSNGKTTPTETVPTAEQYGDYVQYGDSAHSGLDLNGDGDYTNDWRIFYAESEGTYIIAADYVPVSNSILTEAITAANMSKYSNTTSYPYTAYWPDDSYLTKTNITNTGFMNGWTDTTNPSGKATAALLDTTSWAGFATGATGASAIGGPTINLWVASWNATQASDQLNIDNRSMGYRVQRTDGEKKHLDNTQALYFPHSEVVSNCVGYWISSPDGSYETLPIFIARDGGISCVHYAVDGCYSSDMRPSSGSFSTIWSPESRRCNILDSELNWI